MALKERELSIRINGEFGLQLLPLVYAHSLCLYMESWLQDPYLRCFFGVPKHPDTLLARAHILLRH